jgi:hypothetical protein
MSCALSLVVACLPPQGAEAANTNYYVSASTGNDGNSGTLASPFKTINKCAQTADDGDKCIIATGTYRETVTPANSGTSTAPISFEAAPGATVVVSGTEILTGWTQHAGNIYSAPIAWDLGKENQFFVTSGSTVTPLWEARWPNINSYDLPGLKAGVADADGGSATTLVDSALTQATGYWNGATIWLRGGNAYQGMTSTITGFDSASDTLTYSPITGNYKELYPIAGSTYFLSGIYAALDAPKEWYVDAVAQKVYLWAPNGGVPVNVEMKKRKTAFNLNGKEYIRLSGIRTFAANITMDGSNYNVLDGITAEYVYFSDFSQNTTNPDQLHGGISIIGHDNEIKNSTIAYSSGTLVNIDGSNNRIVNNTIHNGSYMASYDPLVKLSSGTENLISRNEIRDSGRYNIYWKSGSGEISYNDISNGMWLSRDGALVYSWGTDMGNTEVHHNLIHDSVHDNVQNDTRVGLYFDNFTENVIAHHNVIYGNDVGIQLNTPGNFKLLYNNTVVDNKVNSIAYWGSQYNEELYGTRVFNNIFTDPAFLTADTVRGFNIISGDGVNFANAAADQYHLNAGSTAMNMGAVIPGITDGYVGPAPDAGAYEIGEPVWTAGPNPSLIPGPYEPVDTPYMNLVKNSAFERGLTDWTPWTSPPSAATVTEAVPSADSSSTPNFQKRGYGSRLKLGAGGGVEQLITGLKPNTPYKFVAWVYTDTANQPIYVGVLNYGGTTIDVAQNEANTYVRKEVSFTTGATDTSARVRIWRAAGATGSAYADDTGLIEATAFDPDVYENQAKDKTQITASGSLGFPTRLTDGYTDAYTNMDDTGPQWVKIDLGQSYMLDKVNLLHYFTEFDQRKYHDVIVQLSNDSNFAAANTTTVFNNDTDGSAGQGTGTHSEYWETADGEEITFQPVNARYIRLWSNGNTKNSSHHYTEVEAHGVPAVTPTTPDPQGYGNVAKKVTAITVKPGATLNNAFRITDEGFTAFTNIDNPGPQWIQIDLGLNYWLKKVKVWHYYADARTYEDVIIQLSSDPNFAPSNTTTVYNNDDDNSSLQGYGTDPLYVETSDGLTKGFPATKARYVRLWTDGSDKNSSHHYTEVEVYGSQDYGMGT